MSALQDALTSSTAPVVVAKDLRQVYKISRGVLREPARLQAVGGVSFAVLPGKTLAVVGESGCGKSTLARMVSLIEPPSAGELRLNGVDVVSATHDERRVLRRAVQLVFQRQCCNERSDRNHVSSLFFNPAFPTGRAAILED